MVTSAVRCARRCRSTGSAPSLPTPLPKTSLLAAVGVAPALPSILTLSVALFPCAPPLCRSCSFLLRLCTPFLCVLSGHLPFCHSEPWDSLPLHGLYPRFTYQVCITRPPPGTVGGYTSVERRWRCVRHFIFSCKAFPPDCPDPTAL
jgi:hypothetical protein